MVDDPYNKAYRDKIKKTHDRLQVQIPKADYRNFIAKVTNEDKTVSSVIRRWIKEYNEGRKK